MTTRLLIFGLLLLLSLATLLAAIFGSQNRTGFAVATTVFHLFLIMSGYAVAMQYGRIARQRESKPPTTPLDSL